MTCDDYRAARLSGDDSAEVRAHWHSCASCRQVEPALTVAHAALGGAAVWEEPSPELEAQVMASIVGAAPDAAADRVASGRFRWFIRAGAAAAVLVTIAVITLTRPPAADWEVALVATEAAPSASATVRGWNEDSGTRLSLEIEGLDPAPDGFFYEFWLSEGPIHISAGTFHSPGDVELWAGVSRADYPRLWITLEPIDEDESPAVTVLDTPQEG